MRWFGDPPCIEPSVVEASSNRVVLRGPGAGQRVIAVLLLLPSLISFILAGVAGASWMPSPWTLVMAAFALSLLGRRAVVTADAREGLVLRWTLIFVREHVLRIAPEQLARLELVRHEYEDSETHSIWHRVVAVTIDGRAYPFAQRRDARAAEELRARLQQAVGGASSVASTVASTGT